MIYRGAVREDIEGPRFLCNLRKIFYKSSLQIKSQAEINEL